MFEVQKLKQQVYKQVEESGLFRQVQAQLKTQVLTNLESQPSAKQNALGFSYQHPLLSKLQKYNITHVCLDLIQQFLESFKFQYTLSVFMKQVNRTVKVNRDKLGKELNIESNQAVLLTAVEILRNGEVARKKESVYLGVPEDRFKKQVPQQEKPTSQRFEKEVVKPKVDKKEDSKPETKGKQVQKQKEQQVKESKKQKQTVKQKQKEKEKQPVSPSPSPPPSAKPKKEQPKTANDFLASITEKMKPKDEPKRPVYERALSAPAAPMKAPPPPQTGTNKIGGLASTKQSPFSAFLKTATGGSSSMNKDPYSYDLKSKPVPPSRKKSEEDIDEQIDQFLQSRDSTRRNPLFSSTEEGLQSMGYDQSVDSNAIQDMDYYQPAKKRKK